MALTARTLVKLGVDKRTARAHAPYLVAAMRESDITTKARAEMFLAQLFHESIMLSTFEELASGAAYEGRKDLGNVRRGDGVRFKGRGPIQVTGRANYKWMSEKLGADFVSRPKLLATARYGYRAAAAFWTRAKLNAKADKGDFEGVTRAINGAATWNAPSHQARRVALLTRIRKVDVRPGRAFLRRGDKGDAVIVLTRRLSFVKSPMTGTHYLDGKRETFDGATVKALKRFQTEHALKPDGRFGPASAEALAKAVRRKQRGGDPKPHPTPKPPTPVPDRRPAPRSSGALIGELVRLDKREDHILDTLIARGRRLEQRAGHAARRERVVTPTDLAPVKAGLVTVSAAIDELQAQIRRAEAVPAEPAPAATNGKAAVTFAELGARIEQHDAEAELLRSLVRDRLGELEPGAKPARSPRTFTLTPGRPMKGADVKAFQRLLNLRFDAWNIDRRIAESGVYDAETRSAAKQVTQALGLLPQAYEHGITPQLRGLIRTPSRRTPQQRDAREGAGPLPGQAARALRRQAQGEGREGGVRARGRLHGLTGRGAVARRDRASARPEDHEREAPQHQPVLGIAQRPRPRQQGRLRLRHLRRRRAHARDGQGRAADHAPARLQVLPAQGADQHVTRRDHDHPRRPSLPRAGDLPRLRPGVRRQPPQPHPHRRQARRLKRARPPRPQGRGGRLPASTARWSRA